MGKGKQQRKLTFKEAVEATPDVASGYQEGINAFGKYADKIIVPDPDKIDGSLDIDETTLKLYPDDNRWDYALCYDSEVLWLKIWLATKAPEINKLTTKTKQPFYWVQSSKCDIPKHMPQYKTVVQNKILPMPVWDYNIICKKKK